MTLQDGRILACTACQDSQSVASATSSGTLHVWRVEYTSKAGGMPDRYTGITGAIPFRIIFKRKTPWCCDAILLLKPEESLKDKSVCCSLSLLEDIIVSACFTMDLHLIWH